MNQEVTPSKLIRDSGKALSIFRARITNPVNLKIIIAAVMGKPVSEDNKKIKTELLEKLEKIKDIPADVSTITDEEVRRIAALLIKFRGALSTQVDEVLGTSLMERFNDKALKPYLFAPIDQPVIMEDVLCPPALYDGCSPRSELGKVRTGDNGNQQVTLGGRKHKTKKHKKKGKKKTMKKKGKKKTMKKKGKKKSMKKKGKKKSMKKKGKKSRK